MKRTLGYLRPGRLLATSKAFSSTIPESVIVPKPEIPEIMKLPTEKKLNCMNVIQRENIHRADHDGRASLFIRRASPKDKMMPGDIVMVEIRNNLTNPDFTSKFLGICIGIFRKGIDTSFILRNVVLKSGVEMRFKAFSPLVKKVEILRKSSKIRRAKLYYLRDRQGSAVQSKHEEEIANFDNDSGKKPESASSKPRKSRR
ncbi:hypothetical protein BB560_002718 [Smittium megazygosporum]|uniref:Ribosomal protein L19 n=1 Tax=Smittium megazygosporum TaxID=133381 RepID=A0A2T9ZDZ3_9FUNG|nr:hypothetical protein BB560_002718 [Smittium megazygosporum]